MNVRLINLRHSYHNGHEDVGYALLVSTADSLRQGGNPHVLL